MKRLLATFTIAAMALLGIALPHAANAASVVPCTPVAAQPNSPQWPPHGAVMQCGSATHGALVLSTVQALGAANNDAATKLQQTDHIDAGDVVSVTISDTMLPGGAVTVSYTAVANDSLPGIATGIANVINTTASLQGKFKATVSGIVVTVKSLTKHGTLDKNITGTGTETVTVSPSPQGGGHVTIGLPVMWYNVANHDDYYNTSITAGGPFARADKAIVQQPGLDGVTRTLKDKRQASAIFDSDAPQGTHINNTIAHDTAHETGHIVDFREGSSTIFMSSISNFKTALTDIDEKAIKQMPACTFDTSDRLNQDGNPYSSRPGKHGYYASSGTIIPNTTGGLPGFVTAMQDAQDNYICDSNGGGRKLVYPYDGYSLDGKTNLLLIQHAYPWFQELYAATLSANQKAGEIFAEEFAVISGFKDIPDGSPTSPPPSVGSDQAFSANSSNAQSLTGFGTFVCTSLYTYTLTNYGRLPSSTEKAGSSYTAPNQFKGDAYGVIYGPLAPPNADSSGNYLPTMYSTTTYKCDGTTSPGGMYSFGS